MLMLAGELNISCCVILLFRRRTCDSLLLEIGSTSKIRERMLTLCAIQQKQITGRKKGERMRPSLVQKVVGGKSRTE